MSHAAKMLLQAASATQRITRAASELSQEVRLAPQPDEEEETAEEEETLSPGEEARSPGGQAETGQSSHQEQPTPSKSSDASASLPSG